MRLEREIPLRVGGLAIDRPFTCKLTVVLSTNRYVEKGYLIATFVSPLFNREVDQWLDAVQVLLQGLVKAS